MSTISETAISYTSQGSPPPLLKVFHFSPWLPGCSELSFRLHVVQLYNHLLPLFTDLPDSMLV